MIDLRVLSVSWPLCMKHSTHRELIVGWLGLTLFLSAFLLFWCQPMIGKMVLPHLGGAAAVWTTCVLFFQAILLIGYLYAHGLARISSVRAQIVVHGIVLLAPFRFLPLTFSTVMTESDLSHPAASLLLKLVSAVGIPFFVVSTSAPLLQNWLSRTDIAAGKDPYFLYAASNAGSLLALIGYPFAVEPIIGVTIQSSLWKFGYLSLVLMTAVAAVFIWRQSTGATDSHLAAARPQLEKPKSAARVFWVVAAFVSSGLMLAATTHITSDLAAAPFLWILPLAIYLLTFIIAFAQRRSISLQRVAAWLPAVLMLLFPVICADVAAPPGLNWFLTALHLILLFVGALYCHSALAATRPEPQFLTEFYFWTALGGVLGGVFTATIAPILFSSVLEYPILVAFLAFLRVLPLKKDEVTFTDFNRPIILVIVLLLAVSIFGRVSLASDIRFLFIAHVGFLMLLHKYRQRPLRFALTLSVLIGAYSMVSTHFLEKGVRLYSGRNFFGVKRILQDGKLRALHHGNTVHGVENTDPALSAIPLSYYYRGSAPGDVVDRLRPDRPLNRIAVVGLGTGSMAGYATPGRQITFYDIDPQVETIAREYFTFLSRCGSACRVVVGDGRLELQRVADGSYDLLMLDAFSSDAIPAHLVSREALKVYLAKLAPDGILLFHVSNRYLNVQKLVSELVLDGGLVGFHRIDKPTAALVAQGVATSTYVVAAHCLEDLGNIASDNRWTRLSERSGVNVWTDDYSSLLQLVKWY